MENNLESLLAKPKEEKDWQSIAISLAKELEARKEVDKDKEFLEKIEATKGETPFQITPEREALMAEKGLWKSPSKEKSRTDPRWYSQPTEREKEIARQNLEERKLYF